MLRMTLGITAIIYGITNLSGSGNAPFSILAIALFAILCGALLIIGLMTPIISLIVFFINIGIASSVITTASNDSSEPLLSAVYIGVTALALALIGPGAFSLDSLIFGRREILIPGKSNTPKS